MVHTPLNDCCNDCRNSALIARYQEKVGSMTLRIVDLENGLRNCREELQRAGAPSPSIELATKLLGEHKHD